MNRILCSFLVMVFLIGVAHIESAQAIRFGDTFCWFLDPGGPTQVKAGNKLKLTIIGEREDPGCPSPAKFQVTVIDPADGIRVWGPKNIRIDPFSGDTFTQSIRLGPIGAEFTDKLLAVGIVAVAEGIVVSATGWVFAVVP